MIKIIEERSYYTGEEINGKGVLRAELIADTAAELSGVTEVGGNKLDFGSIAHAIDDAQILQLNSSGDWMIQTGDNAGKTPAEVAAAASVQSPKSAQGEQRKTDVIDLKKVLDEDDEEEREPLPEIDEPIEEKDEKKEVVEPEPEPERKESGELKEVSADDKPE